MPSALNGRQSARLVLTYDASVVESGIAVSKRNDDLEKLLGPLEADVVRAAWAIGEPVSVRQLLDRLNERRSPPLAYTTVMTVMNRLAEKGILRRAMTGILPDDARTRRKSAYPSSQNPTYEAGLRQWTLQILKDANAPIQPFINAAMIRPLAEGKIPLPGEAAIFLLERVIQVNAWLQEYGVSVV